MPTTHLACDLPNPRQTFSATTEPSLFITPPKSDRPSKEELRHILLGSPHAIRQTIQVK